MIEFFFDFISPYAYLASTRIEALGARIGHEIAPRPVLFAAMLNTLGTKGPAEVPARRAYVVKDIVRAAHRAGVPLDVPPAHPFNPLPALRVASAEADRATQWRIIHSLFAATWAGGGGIDGSARIAEVLRQAGFDDVALLARATEPEAKERLRKNTDEALARGAFGVPTMFIGDEMFFGFDSFPAIEAFARGEDPMIAKAALLERWAKLPAAAIRPKAGGMT